MGYKVPPIIWGTDRLVICNPLLAIGNQSQPRIRQTFLMYRQDNNQITPPQGVQYSVAKGKNQRSKTSKAANPTNTVEFPAGFDYFRPCRGIDPVTGKERTLTFSQSPKTSRTRPGSRKRPRVNLKIQRLCLSLSQGRPGGDSPVFLPVKRIKSLCFTQRVDQPIPLPISPSARFPCRPPTKACCVCLCSAIWPRCGGW